MSSWGRSQDKYTLLWIVLGFEVSEVKTN